MILLAMEFSSNMFDGIVTFLVIAGCGCIGLLFLAIILISKIVWWKTYRLKTKHLFALSICFAPFIFMTLNFWFGFLLIPDLDALLLFYAGLFPVIFFGFVFFND